MKEIGENNRVMTNGEAQLVGTVDKAKKVTSGWTDTLALPSQTLDQDNVSWESEQRQKQEELQRNLETCADRQDERQRHLTSQSLLLQALEPVLLCENSKDNSETEELTAELMTHQQEMGRIDQEISRLQQTLKDERQERLSKTTKAAITLQAAYRGVRVRRRFRSALEERKRLRVWARQQRRVQQIEAERRQAEENERHHHHHQQQQQQRLDERRKAIRREERATRRPCAQSNVHAATSRTRKTKTESARAAITPTVTTRPLPEAAEAGRDVKPKGGEELRKPECGSLKTGAQTMVVIESGNEQMQGSADWWDIDEAGNAAIGCRHDAAGDAADARATRCQTGTVVDSDADSPVTRDGADDRMCSVGDADLDVSDSENGENNVEYDGQLYEDQCRDATVLGSVCSIEQSCDATVLGSVCSIEQSCDATVLGSVCSIEQSCDATVLVGVVANKHLMLQSQTVGVVAKEHLMLQSQTVSVIENKHLILLSQTVSLMKSIHLMMLQ
ncbi:PREDICTED: trichohyalin-like [Priapulus caudatus]|uniref:Trichohyalin-like n=1 Tax=Priapulus caudatus TaxID=37621 RepID=A0ABM1F4D9_PRICU|nr:PREDICTED: trichohyalin-like [Priapulus caudatus]